MDTRDLTISESKNEILSPTVIEQINHEIKSLQENKQPVILQPLSRAISQSVPPLKQEEEVRRSDEDTRENQAIYSESNQTDAGTKETQGKIGGNRKLHSVAAYIQ